MCVDMLIVCITWGFSVGSLKSQRGDERTIWAHLTKKGWLFQTISMNSKRSFFYGKHFQFLSLSLTNPIEINFKLNCRKLLNIAIYLIAIGSDAANHFFLKA